MVEQVLPLGLEELMSQVLLMAGCVTLDKSLYLSGLSTPFCKVSGLGDHSHEPKYLLKKKGKHSILHSSTYLVYYGFCFKARICLYTPGLSQEPLGGLG